MDIAICSSCKKENDTPQFKNCKRCRDKNNAKAKRTKEQRRANNLCLQCGRPRDIPGILHCSTCTEYYRKRHRIKCKDMEYRRKGTIRKRKQNVGLSDEEYRLKVINQHGVCAICGRTNGKRELAADHDHKNGAIRGLLCGNCNRALGQFQDSIEIIEKALLYLRSYQ